MWGTKERPGERELSTPSSVPALQRLRGTADLASELAELEEERAACQGLRAWRPWELFQDRTLRRQVVSLVVLGSAMELCGNDSVRSPAPASPPPPGLCAAGPWEPRAAAGSQCPRAGPVPASPDVRLCVLRVRRGGSPPGEGPVCHHRDRLLRAAHSMYQRESGSGGASPSPVEEGGLGGAQSSSFSHFPLQATLLKYGELASIYGAPTICWALKPLF